MHENGIKFLLGKTAKLIRWNVNNKLSDVGLTLPQMSVIYYLHHSQNSSRDISFNSPAIIAKHLEFDRPTMTGILYRLDKQGWIIRDANPADRRSQTITLTEKSKELIERMKGIIEDINKDILQDFNESEVETLRGYLLRIIDNLTGNCRQFDKNC